MDKKPIPSTETKDQQPLFSPAVQGPSKTHETFEELLETEAAKANLSEEDLREIVSPVLERLAGIETNVADSRRQLTTICNEMERLKNDERILNEMHKRCQELTERHYEREVLGPVFLTLIGLADRSRQQINRYRQLKKKFTKGNDIGIRALNNLIDARTADRVEIESLLANFGVEPYEHEDFEFDSTRQKCIARVPSNDPQNSGRIAQRQLPGYRRDSKIIRQEYVSVYVNQENENQMNKGE